MHQHRRRKKRPSYGVRTVEIIRGKNGFGFTISGQAPCIFSCIISGSPAEKAGLKTGDFLIAVNGQNVSKALHDDVVQLIGNSNGIIKLQIAANYYSDSSDEEFASIVKLRPKYSHKARYRQLQSSVSRAEKVVQDLKTGALFVDHVHGSADIPPKEQVYQYPKFSSMSILNYNRSNKELLNLILQQPLLESSRISLLNLQMQQLGNSTIAKSKLTERKKNKMQKRTYPETINTNSPAEVFHSIFTEQDLNSILYPSIFDIQTQLKRNSKSQVLLKTVVGYLGTIEMPKESQVVNSQLQTIRNCIRRLRIEKKVHTLVLMTVFSECIVLINPDNLVLAEFTADKITFCGVYSDDKKFFGLVTNHGVNADDATEDESSFISSSCHVFMVDPKLTPHHQHIKIAKAFHISCTLDCISNECKEFPDSADTILQAIVSLYRSKVEINVEDVGLEFHANISPQHSNTSGNSSNSDSGIGFRDEGFLLPDASLCSLSISQENGFISSKSTSPPLLANECKNSTIMPVYQSDRLTVRAMPDPRGYDDQSEAQLTTTKEYFMDTFMRSKSDVLTTTSQENQIVEVEHENMFQCSKIEKLSPKVYNISLPVNAAESIPDNFSKSTMWECSVCNIKDFDSSDEILLQMRNLCDEPHEHIYSSIQTDGISLSEHSECTNDVEVTRKWGRTLSLRERERKYLGRRKSLRHRTEAGTVSDGELPNGKVSSSSSLLDLDHMSQTSLYNCFTSDRPIHGGQVASWADSFKRLLEDPAGLHAFREFLKKEFSEENITFWIACEQYQQIEDDSERVMMAQQIYSNHLCLGAQEPVNVDSHARQIAQEGLYSPTPDLFVPAQKQIFNLMKFDCYQRFLKSSIFQGNVFCELQGTQAPFQSKIFDTHSSEDKLRGRKYVEEKKKKSLIPWHKLNKSRSPHSKCKGKKAPNRHNEVPKFLKKIKNKDLMKLDDSSSLQSDVTSSRSSLTGSETEKRTMSSDHSVEGLLQNGLQNKPVSIINNDGYKRCIHENRTNCADWSSNHSAYLETEDTLQALPVYPDFETLTNQIFEDLQNQPEFQCNSLDVIDMNTNDDKKAICLKI